MSNPFDNVLASKGKPYAPEQISDNSHYYDAIDPTRLTGNSRISGDASSVVQETSINAIIKAAASSGLSTSDTALLLAIVRNESGFNPDAAAGTTSASGLGQFVNATGKSYGITDSNRWDVQAQAQAAVDLYIDCYNRAQNLGLDSSHIYALWHDGIGTKGVGDGYKISQTAVMPYVSQYQSLLSQGDYGLQPNEAHIITNDSVVFNKDGSITRLSDKNGVTYAESFTLNLDGSSSLTTNDPLLGATTTFTDSNGVLRSTVQDPISGDITFRIGNSSFSISGAQSVAPNLADGSYAITDNKGNQYTLTPTSDPQDYKLTVNNIDSVIFNGADVSNLKFNGASLEFGLITSGHVILDNATNSYSYNNGNYSYSFGNGEFYIDNGVLGLSGTGTALGHWFNAYTFNGSQIQSSNNFFLGDSINGLGFSQATTDSLSIKTSLDNTIAKDAASGPLSNSWLSTLNVSILNSSLGTPSNSSENTGRVENGIVTGFADAQVGTGLNKAGTDSVANTIAANDNHWFYLAAA